MSGLHGVDYSGGTCNYDKENGIHYGVIPIHDLHEFVWDSFESDYGDPTCPECGNELQDYEDMDPDKESEYETYAHSCCDHFCENCKLIIGSDYAYGESPLCWTLDDGEYRALVDSYNDVMLFKSPFFTYCGFCSPCAPGAGHLRSTRNQADWGISYRSAPKTYCFGRDWFDDNKCPYDIYSVATGELIYKAPAKENDNADS